VRAEAFTLTRDGQILTEGVDYLFNYHPGTGRVVFEAASVFPAGAYSIGAQSRETAGGEVGLLTDLANNTLLPNKFDGSTSFQVFLTDAPGPVGDLMGMPGDQQVTLSWTPPVKGPAVLGYKVRWQPVTHPDYWTDWVPTGSTATEYTVGPTPFSLANGTAYNFEVVAVTAAGDSLPTRVGPLTPFVPAPAPPVLLAIPSQGAYQTGGVVLAWHAPDLSSSGASAILDYKVEYREAGTGPWIRTNPDPVGTGTFEIVFNLVNGRTYEFRVTAITDIGQGYSAVETATPIGLAAAPTGVVLAAGDTGFAARWNATDGGSPILGSRVEWSSDGVTWIGRDFAGASPQAVVAGVANETAYFVRVATRTAEGLSPYSEVAGPVTPRQRASAPTRLIARGIDGGASLTWTAPRETGGLPILDYVVQYAANYAGDPATALWLTVADGISADPRATVAVPNGQAYVFRVAAVTEAGIGFFSAVSETVLPYSPSAVPAAPQGLVGSGGGGQVSLAWNPVAGNAGGVVSDYAIEYRSSGTARWIAFADPVSSQPSATVTRLVPGRAYGFRIAAQNLAGKGSWSDEVTVVA
jgi:hypothetical protein